MMMKVQLYRHDGRWSFLPGGSNDNPAMIVESHWRVDINYETDLATLGGGPCREAFKASEFAVASSGSGMFGLRRAENPGPIALDPPTSKTKGKRKSK